VVQRLKEIEHDAVKKEVEVEQGEQAKAVKAKADAAAPAAAAAAAAGAPASSKKGAKNQPLNQSLESELDAGGNAAVAEMKRKQRELLEGLNLEQ
jgi:hypothetical protein